LNISRVLNTSQAQSTGWGSNVIVLEWKPDFAAHIVLTLIYPVHHQLNLV